MLLPAIAGIVSRNAGGFTPVGTVIMQSAVAVNDVPGSPITLTNLGAVSTNTDGFNTGIDSFVFTRAAAEGISINDHADLDIGAGDFTIESWLKTTTANITSANPNMWANDRLAANSISNPRLLIGGTIADKAVLYANSFLINSVTSVNDGVWHHVSLTRLSGVAKFWIDGTEEDSAPYTTSLSTNGMGIFDWSTNGCIDGELAMFRFTNGISLYTGTFTPPTNLLA